MKISRLANLRLKKSIQEHRIFPRSQVKNPILALRLAKAELTCAPTVKDRRLPLSGHGCICRSLSAVFWPRGFPSAGIVEIDDIEVAVPHVHAIMGNHNAF
jgi:hypothetical protein